MPRVLLVCGSVRRGSVNVAVLRTVAARAPTDVEVELFDGLAGLPHFNPDDDQDPLPPPVVAMRAAVERAGALLFCVPEYAGALPGALKNLLDWTVGGMETVGVPAGWINASTAPTGAVGAHAELRTVLGYTGAEPLEEACVHVPVPRSAIGADGLVAAAELGAAFDAVLSALVARARH